MIDKSNADNVIEKAASAILKGHELSRILSEPDVDSEGREALHVTIVLFDGNLSGDLALDTIVEIQRALQNSGDDRFPIVDFVTEDELTADVDPQF